MKIAMIAAANSPHTIKWANELSKNNEVTVFSMPEHKDTFGELESSVTVQYFTTAREYKKNVKELKAIGGFDVCNAIGADTYGFLAAKAGISNLLLTVLGDDINHNFLYGTKGLTKKALKAAKAVNAASPSAITRVKAILKKTEKPMFVTPFGVDMEVFAPKEKSDETFVFGSTKMLDARRGVDVVIDAFTKVAAQTEKPVKLKIAGSGEAEAALKQKAQSLGDLVEFVGYVKQSDMPTFLQSCDATVQMSEDDIFGVSAIESMACGVPVVSSDTVGASEFILNGVTGYLVKVGKVDRAVECMEELLKYEAPRKKMGAAARQDVEELFDMKNCLPKYMEALEAAK